MPHVQALLSLGVVVPPHPGPLPPRMEIDEDEDYQSPLDDGAFEGDDDTYKQG